MASSPYCVIGLPDPNNKDAFMKQCVKSEVLFESYFFVFSFSFLFLFLVLLVQFFYYLFVLILCKKTQYWTLSPVWKKAKLLLYVSITFVMFNSKTYSEMMKECKRCELRFGIKAMGKLMSSCMYFCIILVFK